jgi:hypothetical protein
MPEYATRPIGDPPRRNFACSSCCDRHFVACENPPTAALPVKPTRACPARTARGATIDKYDAGSKIGMHCFAAMKQSMNRIDAALVA